MLGTRLYLGKIIMMKLQCLHFEASDYTRHVTTDTHYIEGIVLYYLIKLVELNVLVITTYLWDLPLAFTGFINGIKTFSLIRL